MGTFKICSPSSLRGATATKQSIYPRVRADGLLRFARNDGWIDARAFCRHIPPMNMLRSAASTTTATAYGGSPAGCAR
ncbi:hypothetical protein XH93_19695 [Bradyrhizobium sp. CCBAU 51753]|nr:hypothetical protein XH93_19695 [Bradyrhizobium sp. CCBAU 51753]